MPSQVKARHWRDVAVPHRIQLFACGFIVLEGWDFDDLTSPYWRLYWNDRAGGEIGLSGRKILLAPGRLYLIPPRTRFSSRVRRPVGHLYVHFLVEPHYIGPPGSLYSFPAAGAARDVARRLASILGRPPGDRAAEEAVEVSFLAQALLGLALARMPRERGAVWRPSPGDSRIEAAEARIRSHYPRPLSNAALAREAGMHPQAFLRLFRRATGRAPGEYLRIMRIEEASRLLHYSLLPIEEIAQRTGYCDRFHFSRAFRRATGLGPARFRRRRV